MERRVWFDRTFTLGMPPAAFADVLERLRGTPARVQERTANLDTEVLVLRPGDKWSIQEHVGHLLDLEELWHGRTQDLMSGASELRHADLTNRRTDEAAHNAANLDVLLGAFRDIRGRWVSDLESLSPESLAHTALHPRLQQPMTVVDLAFFVAEHDDHHLAAMTSIRRSCGR